MREAPFDIAVVGGGINGCGIARDAAGRGLSVYLCEKDDLASGTSSASTKLIHGGLRYLEYREFRLVREALKEREILLASAPHIIWPMRFILPHHKGLRPAWLLRLGLFLYDNLGGRKLLPGTRRLDLAKDEAGKALKPEYRLAFEYSDCWVEDSRLVVLNAMDAAARGAVIETRTEMTRAVRKDGLWVLTLHDRHTGAQRERTAKALVNAAGPWVGEVVTKSLGLPIDAPVRLVKGSHIVVPKLFAHSRAYFFQNADGRIFFAIPYERDFTLIGTTDLDFTGDLESVEITEAEIAYLCNAANGYFREQVRPSDIVWSYAGVRPLYDDGASEAQSATRDYVLKVQGEGNLAPVLNIYGGKITTYRRLAEAALQKLSPYFPNAGKAWTAGSHLPGGDFAPTAFDAEVDALRKLAPACKPDHARRLVRAYGTRARTIVEGVQSESGWGEVFGPDLSEGEVGYLMKNEWAETAEDILWRRSKLGLRFTDAEARRLDAWMRTASGVNAPALARGVGA